VAGGGPWNDTVEVQREIDLGGLFFARPGRLERLCNRFITWGSVMYLDPASGSLILQVVIAAALSAFAFMGRVRRATRSFFSSLFNRRQR
jgi:hypothetical protein